MLRYRDARPPAGSVTVTDPLLQAFHHEWLALDKHRRHELVDRWCEMPDDIFYGHQPTYMQSLVRLSTLWLRCSTPRLREQVVTLAHAHGRKFQDVSRDLDKLLLERQRAAMIWRERSARREGVTRQYATAQAYQLATAVLDDDGDDE
jgi:hypothetical protein